MTLFAPRNWDAHRDSPERFWLPLLSLFTGARLEELTRTKLSDVDRVGAVWGLWLPRRKGTSDARRFVPLPDRVLALGFLDYVRAARDEGVEELLPGPTRPPKTSQAASISKWFRSYLGGCSLTDPSLTFQSLRRTFAEEASRLNVSEAQASTILGLAASASAHRSLLGAYTPAEIKASMDQVGNALPVLPVRGYQSGQFRVGFKNWT